MKIPPDFLEAKCLMSRRWLQKGPEGGVVKPGWMLNLSVAVKSASTNVHAVGVGRKLVLDRQTEELAIRFYVVHKMAMSLLPASARLPEKVHGLPTDVIESPPASITWPKKRTRHIRVAAAPSCSLDRRKQQRPVVGGISSGHFNITAGTIAYFCRSTRDGDNKSQIYALSNNHVFANINRAKRGDEIYQPGPSDGGTPADRFALLERFVKIELSSGKSNRVDAAIAALLPDINYLGEICAIGQVTGTASPGEGMEVCKHGRTTNYTEGQITDVAYDAVVGMNDTSAMFEDQIRIERAPSNATFAEGGDSGSLVLQKNTRKAIGLYFAGPQSGSYGVANPLKAVLEELEIELT